MSVPNTMTTKIVYPNSDYDSSDDENEVQCNGCDKWFSESRIPKNNLCKRCFNSGDFSDSDSDTDSESDLDLSDIDASSFSDEDSTCSADGCRVKPRGKNTLCYKHKSGKSKSPKRTKPKRADAPASDTFALFQEFLEWRKTHGKTTTPRKPCKKAGSCQKKKTCKEAGCETVPMGRRRYCSQHR